MKNIHIERLDGNQITSEIVKSGYFVAVFCKQ